MPRKLICLLAVLLLSGTGIATAQEFAREAESAQISDDSFSTDCLLRAAAICAFLLGPETLEQPRGLHPEGIYIWTQPGAGLVARYHPAGLPPHSELFIDSERLRLLLQSLPEAKPGEAPLFPTEEEYNSGLPLPQIYLLDSDQAQARLDQYMQAFDSWNEAMTEGELLQWRILPELLLSPDAAVVFVTSSGPLEFYFSMDGEGQPRLTNMLFFDYFSA